MFTTPLNASYFSFGCPKANFEPLQRGLSSPMFITHFDCEFNARVTVRIITRMSPKDSDLTLETDLLCWNKQNKWFLQAIAVEQACWNQLTKFISCDNTPQNNYQRVQWNGVPPWANRKVNGNWDKSQHHIHVLIPFARCGCPKQVFQTFFQFIFYVKTKYFRSKILFTRQKYAPPKASNYQILWYPQLPIERGLGVLPNHQRTYFKKTVFPKAYWMSLWQRDQTFPFTEQSIGSEATNHSIGTGLTASRSVFHVK